MVRKKKQNPIMPPSQSQSNKAALTKHGWALAMYLYTN